MILKAPVAIPWPRSPACAKYAWCKHTANRETIAALEEAIGLQEFCRAHNLAFDPTLRALPERRSV